MLNDYTSEKLAERLANFFAESYRERFSISSEAIDATLIRPLVDAFISTSISEQTIEEMLKKAIYWYLFIHDSVDKNGKSYRHSAKIFFEQSWLWKMAIEQTNDATLAMLKTIKNGANKKTAMKALKRGDVVDGFTYNDVTKKLQDTMRFAEELIMQYELPKKFFQECPPTSGLYLSASPDEMYIDAAYEFLILCRERLQ